MDEELDDDLGGFNNFSQLDDETLKKLSAEFKRQESNKPNLDE